MTRKPRYDLMVDVLTAHPNEWHKVSPGCSNGSFQMVVKALSWRLGSGDVQVSQRKGDVFARYLTEARVEA